jgi:hypothetical protein
MALFAIKTARSASALRAWWSDETAHREKYELSQEQIDALANACRDHIRDLGEIAKDAPPPPAPRKHKARQLPLI